MIKQHDKWFKNLESLESILSTVIFDEDGVEGHWSVNQDDLYRSNSDYRSFFTLENNDEKNFSEVLFELKEYDYVGPEDFHSDNFDYEDGSSKPYLQITASFHSKDDQKMKVRMIYPMDDKHLLINKEKRSFRAMTPSFTRVEMEG